MEKRVSLKELARRDLNPGFAPALFFRPEPQNRHDPGDPVFVARFDFVQWNADAEQIRGCCGAPLYDFSVRVQGHLDALPSAYSMEVDYHDIHSADRLRCEKMAAVLRGVERALGRSPVHAVTVGQYVGLVCAALGIADVLVRRGESRGSNWDDADYYRIEPRYVDHALLTAFNRPKVEAT